MSENFRFSGTLETDLERLGRRLQTQGFEQRVFDLERMHAAALALRKPKRPLWTKLRTFLHVFAHLPRLARRFDELRHDVERFKVVLVEATRFEFDAYANQDEKRLDLIVGHCIQWQQTIKKAEDDIACLNQQWQQAIKKAEDDIACLNQQLVAETGRFDGLLRAGEENRLALDNEIRRERLIRQRAFTDLDLRLHVFASRHAASQPKKAQTLETTGLRPAAAAIPALLDNFYYLLEERYRGTRAEIKDRLSIYRPDLRAARQRTGVLGPALDLGCGRGEFLEVMREEGLEALGLDQSDTQLDQARMHGLSVENSDALVYLQRLTDRSIAVISAMHLVEHLAFPDFMRLAEQIERVLMPGGLVIFETPNPRNLIVRESTFHLDPTHTRPLPFEVTEIVLEIVGFTKVEFRPLHASDTYDVMVREKRLDPHIAYLLFGPQDYAALSIKD